MGTVQPPFEYLVTSSQTSLESFELARLAVVSNLRKELREVVDEWIEAEIEARLARWILECRRDKLPESPHENPVSAEGGEAAPLAAVPSWYLQSAPALTTSPLRHKSLHPAKESRGKKHSQVRAETPIAKFDSPSRLRSLGTSSNARNPAVRAPILQEEFPFGDGSAVEVSGPEASSGGAVAALRALEEFASRRVSSLGRNQGARGSSVQSDASAGEAYMQIALQTDSLDAAESARATEPAVQHEIAAARRSEARKFSDNPVAHAPRILPTVVAVPRTLEFAAASQSQSGDKSFVRSRQVHSTAATSPEAFRVGAAYQRGSTDDSAPCSRPGRLFLGRPVSIRVPFREIAFCLRRVASAM